MIRTSVLKHHPEARKGKRGGSKEDVRGGATARGAMEKGWYVGVIEGEEVRKDDPVEKLPPRGGQKYLLSPRGGDGN